MKIKVGDMVKFTDYKDAVRIYRGEKGTVSPHDWLPFGKECVVIDPMDDADDDVILIREPLYYAGYFMDKRWIVEDSQPNPIVAKMGTSLDEIIELAIMQTLDYCDWNKRHAAKMLSIPEKTFYRYMRKYNIPYEMEF